VTLLQCQFHWHMGTNSGAILLVMGRLCLVMLDDSRHAVATVTWSSATATDPERPTGQIAPCDQRRLLDWWRCWSPGSRSSATRCALPHARPINTLRCEWPPMSAYGAKRTFAKSALRPFSSLWGSLSRFGQEASKVPLGGTGRTDLPIYGPDTGLPVAPAPLLRYVLLDFKKMTMFAHSSVLQRNFKAA
jgi:hypothetical protein